MANPDRHEDAELIRAFLEGDRAAFESLVLRHEKSVCNLIHSITRNPSYVDDLAQEIFWKVYLNLKKFKGESSFKTWLYRITVNECLKELGRAGSFKKLRARLAEKKSGLSSISNREKSVDLEEIIDTKEKQDNIRGLVNSLSPLHRTILFLRYNEGLSVKEMAQVLNCPLGTIGSRLHNARNELKDLLLPFMKERGEH